MNVLPLVFSGQRCPNILFSRLRPGAKIPPHNGMINTRLIGHLPLIIPEDCGFRVGNSTRTWNVGEAFLFDDTIEHEAWNNSSEDRFVLIFEVWRPELTEAEQRLRHACSLQWIATDFVQRLTSYPLTLCAHQLNRDGIVS